MKVYLALAASPLTELHLPQTFDTKSLRTHLSDIPEFRKGMVIWDVKYDTVGNEKPHHSARVNIETDMGSGFIEFELDGAFWKYEGQTIINGEKTLYEGSTVHNSVQSICRKVRGLTMLLL